MGKSTISMAIFNSYVKLPEGRSNGAEALLPPWCQDKGPCVSWSCDRPPVRSFCLCNTEASCGWVSDDCTSVENNEIADKYRNWREFRDRNLVISNTPNRIISGYQWCCALLSIQPFITSHMVHLHDIPLRTTISKFFSMIIQQLPMTDPCILLYIYIYPIGSMNGIFTYIGMILNYIL